MWLWWFRGPTCHLQAREPGKLLVQFHSKYKGLRTRRIYGGSPNFRAEDLCPTWKSQEEKVNSPLFCLFVLFRPSTEQMMSTHTGKQTAMLLLCTKSNANLTWKHPHKHSAGHPMLIYRAGHLMTQSSWHIWLTVINMKLLLRCFVSKVYNVFH